MKQRPIAYEPHPVTPARKAELKAQGFKIIDIKFAPPGAFPTVVQPAIEIPEDWASLHHFKLKALAEQINGQVDPADGQTMTDRAREIIGAYLEERG